MQKIDYAIVKKDCFWDLDILQDNIQKIITSGDTRKKRCFFKKFY